MVVVEDMEMQRTYPEAGRDSSASVEHVEKMSSGMTIVADITLPAEMHPRKTYRTSFFNGDATMMLALI